MKLMHSLSYLGLTLLSAWLSSLSERERNHLALFLARLMYHKISIRKNVALKNIQIAFPNKTIEQQNHILKKSYSFFALHFLRFLSFPKSYRHISIDVSGKKLFDNALAKGRGIILVTAHFGLWEIMAAWLGFSGYPCVAVALKQKNKGSDSFFRKFRYKTGMKMIYRKSSLDNMARVLKDNKILILGSDQDAKKRGVFVDFFNKPASTPKGTALFYLQTGAPVLFISCHENKNRTAILEISTVPIDKNPTVESITQTYTTMLENIIRKYPEQYFWFHRRWKTRADTE